jgi:membrane protein implicated in regulation of membrane protease activity
MLARLRGSPWLAGALLLALAGALAAPVLLWLGLRSWPAWVGLAAVLVLLFGWLERFWQRRPLPQPRRVADRRRFRVVPGGKGNGHAHDVTDDEGDKPRWLM